MKHILALIIGLTLSLNLSAQYDIKFDIDNYELKICYEASYLGFSLHRELTKKNYFVEVIAPSLIPEISSKKVKTDKLDAQKLARYYSNDLLTIVYVPSEENEADATSTPV